VVYLLPLVAVEALDEGATRLLDGAGRQIASDTLQKVSELFGAARYDLLQEISCQATQNRTARAGECGSDSTAEGPSPRSRDWVHDRSFGEGELPPTGHDGAILGSRFRSARMGAV
jgi:hypothetical protein